MRKIKNVKKKTIYTVLFIVVAVLIVGYAFLSSTLNIFGGLGIIPGNINWGVKFNNIQVNNESTAGVSVAPTLGSNNTSVNFAITLDQPGKFYEFTVDAVNTGSIDAMIDSLHYNIYDEEDNEIYPQYLYYTVDYINDISLSTGHLLRAGETATYKVRIEFSDDIDMDELPSEEKQLRFEFGVTYIQADDTAYEPGSLTKIDKMIIVGDTDAFDIDKVRNLFSGSFNIVYAGGYSFTNTAAGGVDIAVQAQVKDYVEEYGAENIVIAMAYAESEAAEIAAETFTIGDPTYSGPLAGIALHAPVYHIFDDALYNYYDEDVFNNYFSPKYNNGESGYWIGAVSQFREQYSVHHLI